MSTGRRPPRSPGRKLGEKAVQALQALDVLVEHVEEDRVQQVAEDLGRRRVAPALGPFGFRGARLVAGRDGEDAAGTQAEGRGQRRREADAAVAVPGVAEAHGRKEEGQGGGGHDVVDAEPGVDAAVPGLVPGSDVVPLDPGDRLPGGVVEGRQGEGLETSLLQVALDADDSPSTVAEACWMVS